MRLRPFGSATWTREGVKVSIRAGALSHCGGRGQRRCRYRNSDARVTERNWRRTEQGESNVRQWLVGFAVGVLLLPVTLLIAARLGLFPIRADARPPRWGAAFAHMALAAAAARQAPHVNNPIAPTEANLMA